MRPPPLLGAGLHLRRCRAPLTAPASSPFAACRAGIRLRRCRARERWIRCRRRLPVPEGACGALPGAAASDVDRGGRSTGEEERGVLLLLRQQVRAQIPSQQRAYFLHLASSRLLEEDDALLRKKRQQSADMLALMTTKMSTPRARVSGVARSPREAARGLKRFLSFGKKKRGGRDVTVIDCSSPSIVAGLKHMRTLMEEWPKCFGGC
uniref:Uncharacterized protein n=1 Tax=Oryza nivara TaxID=4536 RepID=A0A0E0IQM1_ORYNI